MDFKNKSERDLPETGVSLHSLIAGWGFLIHALWYVFGLAVAFYGVYLVAGEKSLIYGIIAIALGLTVVGIMVYEIYDTKDERMKT